MHNFLMEALADGSNPPMLCNMWHIYVFALSQTLATLLELILASRGKSKPISLLEDTVRLDKAHSICSV